jgi:hypothetical protein
LGDWVVELVETTQSPNQQLFYPSFVFIRSSIMAFTLYSTVGKIMSNEQAKALVEKHFPGSTSHPMLSMAWGMTLGEVASFPEAGITSAKLQAFLVELAKIADG